MNDRGQDDAAGSADGLADQTDDLSETRIRRWEDEEEERSFLQPARWWYASTVFPLIAGTFGPMASAFSVCALVENWRVEIPAGGAEEQGTGIKDPPWLLVVNAVSLACALVANLSLLLNMTRRVPFYIAQPVTIIGFWVASLLLIVLVAVAANDLHAPGVKHQALSQAYYYAAYAAGLYQIISYLMCVTVYGAYRGGYNKEFKLTMAQRTLMLQTISFLTYQLLGALVFSRIEGWKYLDAVYWADFTSLTIGLGGEFTPKTHLGRSLLFPFAMGGILILGLIVGSIRTLVLDRGKKTLAARMTEKTRLKLVKRVADRDEKKWLKHKPVMGLPAHTARALTLEPGDTDLPEVERRQAEFDAMRRVQHLVILKRKWFSLLTSSFAFAFLWLIGALVFFITEKNQHWSYFESIYFAYTTLLTIGYGDFKPTSSSGRSFFVFWSLLAVPTLTILISDMGDTVVKVVKDVTIWLGEITVLPNDESSPTERLKYGLYKVSFGRVNATRKFQEEEAASEAASDEQELEEPHGGQAPTFGLRQKRLIGDASEASERLASEFEESEELDESEARERGDIAAVNEHRYRHELISQIRKVYEDTMAATPKKYSFEEWAYFLKLLGEDERDVTYHGRPPVNAPDHRPRARTGDADQAGQADTQAPGEVSDRDNKATQIKKWSWIGHRSPLMGGKDEAEWLLDKLFQRLEESLREKMKKEEAARRERMMQHGDPAEEAQRPSD